MGRKILAILISVCLWMQAGTAVKAEEEKRGEPETDQAALELTAPSAILLEASTGQVLFEKDADEERSPASITKIMTLLLIFEELEKGNLELTEPVTTSAYAKSMGGSQVFLEEGEQQTVETMIKCIVVASGNDASVAMAEHIAGSEEEFVRRMNQKAAALGMEHTQFEDCCGLTDSAGHYTTARDVATVSRELISRFPGVLEYSSIWMEDITHTTAQGTKEFTLTNTNKMIHSYEGCMGLKTGSTSVAKYCVSSVARRENVELIAVVMGAPEPKGRFADAAAMLNYGFGICRFYEDKNEEPLEPVQVSRSVRERVGCEYARPFRYLDTRGQALAEIRKEIRLPEKAEAPVKKGDVLGKAVYLLNGTEIGSVDLIAAEDAPEAGITDFLGKTWRELLLLGEGERVS